MKIKQLVKVMGLGADQTVRINDEREHRTIESVGGWVLEPDYDYSGYNYNEVERIMNLTVTGMAFNGDTLTIWAG
ncbi:MAG: hypothetical protein IKH57_23435 [Clostridia bacterium]|nr:hypothetical protein [Clostridia bacterium]